MASHGLFMGEGCITDCGPLFDPNTTGNRYGFQHDPIDAVDGAARRHDIRDSDFRTGAGWLEDVALLGSDEELLSDFNNYKKKHKTRFGKTPKGVVDGVTGRTASAEATFAAKTGSILFGAVVDYKQWKKSKIEGMGKDPNAAGSQGLVKLDDYKGKHWWNFKRNANYKILKASSEEKK